MKLRNDKEINALFASAQQGVQLSQLHQQSKILPQISQNPQKRLAQDILPRIAISGGAAVSAAPTEQSRSLNICVHL